MGKKDAKVVNATPSPADERRAAAKATAQAKPYIRYVEIKFSRWQFAKSVEVLFSLVVLSFSLYLVFFSPSTMHLTTSRGMVMQVMKKKRTRLASRAAQKEGPEAAMLYTDLVMLGIIGLATTSFVHGCARRIQNAQKRVETAELDALREALYNPEALATLQGEVAEDRKAWDQENAQRVAKGRAKLRERRVVKSIATSETLTSFFVIVTVIMTAIVAILVQVQTPNEVRGLGAVVVILVLAGGIICPSCDPTLNLELTYCVVCQMIFVSWILGMCFLSIRATWD